MNDIPQEHRTRFAAAFGSIQKLRIPSSEDNIEKSTTKPSQPPTQNNRERKRSSCEITLSQNNLHKIGQPATGSSNVVTGSSNLGTGMTHGFSQNDLDEAEKLFKTDSKFASLFQAAEVSTSPSEDSEASSDSENSSEVDENPKKNSRRGSRLQNMKLSGHRDSGISSNRNEDEELTILPMEVEIIQANRDEERKKNKPRIKANSAGQEPPAVPPKAGFLNDASVRQRHLAL